MILFYIPNFSPGGAERVMIHILNSLFDHGYQVELLVGKNEGPIEVLVNPDIKIHHLGFSSAKFAWFPLLFFLFKRKPQMLITTLGASVSTAMARASRIVSFKFISRLGNTIGAEKQLFKSSLKLKVFIFLNQFIANVSDQIIVQSLSMKKDFIKEVDVLPEKVSLIYNPVDVEEIKEKSQENVRGFDLLAVGRLLPQKDYPTMLAALSILKQEGIKLNLGIIGTGDLIQQLEALVLENGLENQVIFLGYQSNPYAYLNKSKLLVSSSKYEGFSNVIIESLALGTPVVATDCPGGNAEVIKSGFNGLLCQVADPEDMARKIKWALDNRGNFNKQAIKEDVVERFDLRKITDQYIEVMEKVLGKPLPKRH